MMELQEAKNLLKESAVLYARAALHDGYGASQPTVQKTEADKAFEAMCRSAESFVEAKKANTVPEIYTFHASDSFNCGKRKEALDSIPMKLKASASADYESFHLVGKLPTGWVLISRAQIYEDVMNKMMILANDVECKYSILFIL